METASNKFDFFSSYAILTKGEYMIKYANLCVIIYQYTDERFYVTDIFCFSF